MKIENMLTKNLERIFLCKPKYLNKTRIIVTSEVKRNRKYIISVDDYESFAFEDGDVLKVQTVENVTPHTTPDGCWNLLTNKKTPVRIPPKMKFGEYLGYKLPLHLVDLTGAGIETMGPIGGAHVNAYEKFMGITEGASVLEIGCGIGRDALELIRRNVKIVSYVGIDVTHDSILWCKNNISLKYQSFKFYHFNAKHELYNPLGSRTSLDFKLPVEDKSIDRIFLGSVFTHLFEDEVTHYMKEISRVLRSDGVAYATIFLYSPEIIEAARRTRRSHNGLLFEHIHGDGCYVSDPDYVTGSVAFTEEAMNRMMANAGLRLAQPILPGWWSGYFDEPVDGQEVALLTPA